MDSLDILIAYTALGAAIGCGLLALMVMIDAILRRYGK